MSQQPPVPPEFQGHSLPGPSGQPPLESWPPPGAPPGYGPQPRRPRRSRKGLALAGCGGLLGAAVLIVVVAALAASPSSSPPPGSVQAHAPSCTSYRAVGSREWLQIAKDPDAAKGQCVTVYGEVTQFDAVTGTGEFRAQAGGVRAPVTYGIADYPTNVLFEGGKDILAPLVQGDLFTAHVRVEGTQSYDTTLGGSTTAPLLHVDSVRRTGHLGS